MSPYMAPPLFTKNDDAILYIANGFTYHYKAKSFAWGIAWLMNVCGFPK